MEGLNRKRAWEVRPSGAFVLPVAFCPATLLAARGENHGEAVAGSVEMRDFFLSVNKDGKADC